MKFTNSIHQITEDVQKLSEFYQNVLQTNTDINNVHVEITVYGGGLTIYSKSVVEKDMGFNFNKYHSAGMNKFTFSLKTPILSMKDFCL